LAQATYSRLFAGTRRLWFGAPDAFERARRGLPPAAEQHRPAGSPERRCGQRTLVIVAGPYGSQVPSQVAGQIPDRAAAKATTEIL